MYWVAFCWPRSHEKTVANFRDAGREYVDPQLPAPGAAGSPRDTPCAGPLASSSLSSVVAVPAARYDTSSRLERSSTTASPEAGASVVYSKSEDNRVLVERREIPLSTNLLGF
jgi:hypothetical protein